MSNSGYAFKLSQKLGWPHTLEEWRVMENAGTLLTLGEPPELDGTAVVTHYDWGSALGMFLIEKTKQKSGMGMQFMRQIIKIFEERAQDLGVIDSHAKIVLSSSHEGERLYSKTGFQPIGSVVVLKREGQHAQQAPLKGTINVSGEEISKEFYDACPVRTKILQGMIEGAGHSVCLTDSSGNIEAFASSFKRVSSSGREALAIGPILGNKKTSVANLMASFISSTSIDLTVFSLQDFKGQSRRTNNCRTDLLETFSTFGFRKTDELQFMSHGGRAIPHFTDIRKVSPVSLAFS